MFLTDLDLRAYEPDEFIVLDDLLWKAKPERADEPEHVMVPRGFITDLASIPIGLRNVLDINGRSRKPAVLHDFLYCSQPCSRATADALFRRALEAEGVNVIARNAYYAGVRLGGWIYWKARKKGLGRDDFVPPGYWEKNP